MKLHDFFKRPIATMVTAVFMSFFATSAFAKDYQFQIFNRTDGINFQIQVQESGCSRVIGAKHRPDNGYFQHVIDHTLAPRKNFTFKFKRDPACSGEQGEINIVYRGSIPGKNGGLSWTFNETWIYNFSNHYRLKYGAYSTA